MVFVAVFVLPIITGNVATAAPQESMRPSDSAGPRDPARGHVRAQALRLTDNRCTVDTSDPVSGPRSQAPLVCNDGNPCTDDFADPYVGCKFIPNDSNPCDPDMNFCTVERCANGLCVIVGPRNCNDNNVCTVDSCDYLRHCVHQPVECEDGLTCTENRCDAVTGCFFPPVVCAPGPCDDAICIPTQGGCVFWHDDTNQCSDGSPCTEDACESGICVSGPTSDPDRDGVCSPPDNCPNDPNPSQDDSDADGQGDSCDLTDGRIMVVWTDAGELRWQQEAGFTSWNVYEGNLGVLKATSVYTQPPGSNPLAARTCGLAQPVLADVGEPPAGQCVFCLVTGVQLGGESGLGQDSAGAERPNTNPCP